MGVSCTSATACTAVGTTYSSTGYQAIAEFWNGTGWTTQATTHLAGWDSSLTAVSCTSAVACLAVGNLDRPGAVLPLAERWDGQTWRLELPQTPGDGQVPTLSELSAVSCTSAAACTAVGNYKNSSGVDVTFAERYS